MRGRKITVKSLETMVLRMGVRIALLDGSQHRFIRYLPFSSSRTYLGWETSISSWVARCTGTHSL